MDKHFLENLFPNLEPALLDEIYSHAVVREVKAGDTLLKLGQNIRSTMLIMEGYVKLYREDEEGREFFIYQIGPGQACSLSMVCATNHKKSEVMARALTDATVLSVPLDFMEKWMKKYKSWYQFVINSYSTRFEELLKTVDAIAFSNMDSRLKNYLEKQVRNLGPKLKTKQQDIANDLNTSREVISRLLKKMEARGWVKVNRNSIEWLSPLVL